MDLDEKEMMKDIMDDGVVSGKDIHTHSVDDLEFKKFKKMKNSKKRKDHEMIRSDHHGDYIDDYADEYHKTKHDIIDTLDGKSKYRKNFDEDILEEFHGKHLSEEEWNLKEKKERENLDELIAKEKELEAAQKDVKAAEESLSAEKKKIDDEINEKIHETEVMRKEFERKATERAEAERRAAELREKVELEER